MMKFEYLSGKARWTDGKETGNWQSIKADKKGRFIRKGTEKLYLPKEDVPEQPVGQTEKEEPDLEDFDKKVFHAYYESKTFWDSMFGLPPESTDYFFYRSKIEGYGRNFFIKK